MGLISGVLALGSAGVTRRARESCLADQAAGDRPAADTEHQCERLRVAAQAKEPFFQPAAIEVGLELLLHMVGQWPPSLLAQFTKAGKCCATSW